MPDRYLRDGAELGAEFSAYRLDLALGALLQDLDRSAVSPPQADIRRVLCHAALNSH
ncbi:hypothetical protein AB9F43_32625 [Rhizobium leguminosarum]|uniref:hypothetical protein n=1 Tax=Rhizobium leguminosarum TaxID=384 RepID=UPI003F95B60E